MGVGPPPRDYIESESDFCSPPDGNCVIDTNHDQCLDLIDRGCPEDQIDVLEEVECPYVYVCKVNLAL